MSTRRKIGSLLPADAPPAPTVDVEACTDALKELTKVLSGFKHPEITVSLDEMPDVNVNVPDQKPLKKMRFTVNRDKSGRIESIDAEIQH